MSFVSNPYISNTEYSAFIALSRYARWLPEQQRRETWEETCKRYSMYWLNKGFIEPKEEQLIYDNICNLKVMPSMRALMTAGATLDRDNIAGFNCSATAVNRIEAFDEIMYILMNGTGVGFSCERQEITNLPAIPAHLEASDYTIVVQDSKEGWSNAYHELFTLLYSGSIPKWDVSLVRPAGTPLKVFGGRASGSDCLVGLFEYVITTFIQAAGRKLNSIEIHGIVCKTAEIVTVGGVRRSALISLSNFSDQRMSRAKSGAWWEEHPEYGLANNSIAYTEKPNAEAFLKEWLNLIESKSGERGIFNRVAAQKQAAKYGRREFDTAFLTNPCAEISLKDKQFCNLSEVIIRSDDTEETLTRKVIIATILGTLQATLTNFNYLGSEWRTNTQSEALLGVSLTGITDNVLTSTPSPELAGMLQRLRNTAVKHNVVWAKKLGINPSAAITTVKPSGTVSQLVDSASGIHPRYEPFYIRTVRADMKDPLARLMKDSGFPCEPDVMKPDTTLVFSFPMKAPTNAVFRNDKTALEQLELWMMYKQNWAEHSVSVTVYVRDEEWVEVGAWVYKHFDEITGISFLPHSNHTYRQAPYQEITEATYHTLVQAMPKNVDWGKITNYELEDRTTSSQTLACTGGVCEVVDLT